MLASTAARFVTACAAALLVCTSALNVASASSASEAQLQVAATVQSSCKIASQPPSGSVDGSSAVDVTCASAPQALIQTGSVQSVSYGDQTRSFVVATVQF